MATPAELFKYELHTQLEALERELVQLISQRMLKEGEDFPGEANVIQVSVEVDLNAISRTAASTRTVRQVQQAEGEEDHPPAKKPRK